MNFLILGDGPEEESWARALADHPEHRLVAACPGLKGFPDLPGGVDLDGALAVAGISAVIVGGEPDLRAEGLRRAASAGFPCLCLHPPGPNADPYYAIALSRQETGAIVVPDLPARLHPSASSFAKAIDGGDLGAFRSLRYEVPAGTGDDDLAGVHFPRAVDLLRSLLGEVEAVTATGDPPGERPTRSLVVQLRAEGDRRGEARIEGAASEPARLVLTCAEGTLTLEHDPAFLGSSKLVRRSTRDGESAVEVPPWDPKSAILDALAGAVAGRETHPDLLDGTRAMELTEAAVRSLRRGRTVDLFYEEMSEAANFKSVMTGVGCGLLLAILILVPAVMAGKALGFEWMTYLLWIVPPVLVFYLVLQLLRLSLKPPSPSAKPAAASGAEGSTMPG